MHSATHREKLTITTESRMRAGRDNTPAAATVLPPIHIAELFATTPPHIRETSNTLANGVHLETYLEFKDICY